MEKPSEITEYYFSDFYRALVVKINENEYMVSIDVYKKRSECMPNGHNVRYVCINDTCLIVEEIDPAVVINSIKVEGLSKIFIITTKVGDNCEIINVKWLVNKKPMFEDVETMYTASWQIISR